MKRTAKFIEAIASGDAKMINDSLEAAIKGKVNTILDIKRVSITTDFLNKKTVSESK